MSETKEEPRSWPERDADEALEALKDGLRRVRSHLADFKQQIARDGGGSDPEPQA